MKIRTLSAAQNDGVNLIFVKDINTSVLILIVVFQSFSTENAYSAQMNGAIYRMRTIITRGLYTFTHFLKFIMYCDLWPYVW